MKTSDQLTPDQQAQFRAVKDNLLIWFVKQAGGEATIPMADVEVQNDTMSLNFNPETKSFIIRALPRG